MEGLQYKSHTMLLSEFFECVYLPRRLRGKSANTARHYRLSINAFRRSLCRDPHVHDLTNENVLNHMQRLLDNGRAKATANKDRCQLLALWRYATKLGLHTTWPDVQQEIEPQRVPQAWLLEDIRSLMQVVDNLDGRFFSVPRRLWWRGLIMVCLDTGERIGAVRQAQWTWIEHDWILFPAESRKGGKRDRRYLLSPATVKILHEIRIRTQSTEVFQWPYCDVYLWKKLDEILVAAGLPHGRKDKFHRFRKTTASVIYAAGMDATDALDHSQRRVTQRYLDPRFARDAQASKIIAAWLRSPPQRRDKKSG